ncbi:hypothetical protein GGR50DRAFT_14068 [Xylaria sp. CBS 124048]|nr:hypothetical protein GGR50DRAFT_14068 [Xylaria sp. CBS 124048]
MLSLHEHIANETARWEVSRGQMPDEQCSITTTSTVESIRSSSAQFYGRYNTRHLSRRSSTSSFATEFEPEPAQPFATPQDFNGNPIPVYASFEAAVEHRTRLFEQWLAHGEGWAAQQQPRRLVTPGKLYENEDEDDAIVYE